MNPTTLSPLSGHAVLTLLLQLALLLALARTLAEAMRRMGQPAVIGELLAGILIGPTVLGHYAPGAFAALFPQDAAQFHLLEVVSMLGMVLLLLLTGLETDLRIMRAMGRAAVLTSAGGLLVNLAAGATLGFALPDAYLVAPETRPIFAAFLATALAITAMPVIGKILIDLNLIRRNVGIVTLSAGVIDDTIGWLLLSVIAGLAGAGSFSLRGLLLTLAELVAFLVVMRHVVYPITRRALHFVNERVRLAGSDVTLILVITFSSAAATEAIGIHAVFGAFVAGLMIRQVPRVRSESLHMLETFVLSALSPIFFAFVGLKVDLWALGGFALPALVIGVAMTGKLVGCYSGARLGGMSHWEGVALGFGMNARGAMELIVAMIGLSLGLLTQQMYSTIVLVAVVTSFLAPLLLRTVVSRLPMSEEERRRMAGEPRVRLLPAKQPRILVPTAGGGNAMGAFALAAALVVHRQGGLTALYVERRERQGLVRRWLGRGRKDLAGQGLDQHLESVAARLGDERKRLHVRRVASDDAASAILAEAGRDYDLLMIGAASQHLAGHSTISEVMAGKKLPAIIVRSFDDESPERFRRILVPVEGSVFSIYAADFAFAYARSVGAEVTLLHVVNETRVVSGSLAIPESRKRRAVSHERQTALAARIREDYGALAEHHEISFGVRILASGDPSSTIIEESSTHQYDLLVLGAENKVLAQPLFFGQGTAAIVERAGCTTAVVVPSNSPTRTD